MKLLWPVPNSIIGDSETEATKDGRSLSDFKYACVGYSLFLDKKDNTAEKPENQAELPFCVGIEVISCFSDFLNCMLLDIVFHSYFFRSMPFDLYCIGLNVLTGTNNWLQVSTNIDTLLLSICIYNCCFGYFICTDDNCYI